MIALAFGGKPVTGLLRNKLGNLYTTFLHCGALRRRYWTLANCSTCDAEVIADRNNFHKHGKAYCSPACKSKGQSGERNSQWGGGRKNKRGKSGGHVLIYAPDHPNAKKHFVPEHRLLVETDTGKVLPPDIVVHHIDLDMQHNVIENLLPVTQKEHNTLHWQLNRLVRPLMEAGIIRFDRVNLRYELTETK